MEPIRLPQEPVASSRSSGAARLPNEAERQLMEEIQRGDEAAFATFYDRFGPGLFSMIFAILHDSKEAEDVLQEAFLQMWKRSATYDAGRSSLFTWAVMISRHKAIDRLRSRQRQARLSAAVADEPEEMTAPAPVGQADELLARSDESERVRIALTQIGAAQREAIDLAFFGGLTQAEISEKLGTPLGTVKARIRRGLLALRDILKAEAIS